jgi:hypothetical protein
MQMLSSHVFFPPTLRPNPLQIAVEKPCVLVVPLGISSSSRYKLSTSLVQNHIEDDVRSC